MKASYQAPWGTVLKITSSFAVLLLIGLTGFLLTVIPPGRESARLASACLPPLILAITAFFAILGYELHPGSLVILRPGWRKTIDLRGLKSASLEPDVMRNSLRLFGNGGLFAFSGWFTNKALGRYRAFATDPKRSVVLRFLDGRVIVVTPDRPEEFVRQIKEIAS